MKEQTSITKSLYQCQEIMNQIEANDEEVSEEQLKDDETIKGAKLVTNFNLQIK